uniref:Uncharacterized protein n=1 Tax=Anguilla anguilla TaxID=7936 RepID=A0A0E9XJD9_ANGAN
MPFVCFRMNSYVCICNVGCVPASIAEQVPWG